MRPGDSLALSMAQPRKLCPLESMLYPVVEIFTADIYRDGGSRCFCYHSDNGNWYEFHVRIRFDGESLTHYDPPVLYLNSVNDGNPVREFSWDEAVNFVSDLAFDHPRFAELVEVVSNHGKIEN